MSKVIRISDTIFERLQRLAEPFTDTPASVIERLLDHYDSEKQNLQKPSSIKRRESMLTFENTPDSRASRQRGAVVKLGNTTIRAESVSDLYYQVLKYLINNGYMKQIEPHIPIATSRKRYLLARKPVHPNGNDFVVPVEYRGYFMEAHKDYKNGIRHLQSRILDLCNLELKYLA